MISLSKEKAKLLKSFQMKKFRQKYNVFVVEGDKLAREILADNQFSIEYIVALESWLQEYAHLVKKHKELCFSCTETQLSDISSLTTANKVLIVAKMPPPLSIPKILSYRATLYTSMAYKTLAILAQ